MSLHHIANHLASKGRNGDTTLVHMTKGEVAGLQALAKANGTSLTRNPDTGLPEAFGLKQLIPIAAGVALGPAGFGIASSAMGAGLMVGGAYALGTGSLKQGLIAGLGAYGGAGLTGAGAAAGTQPVAGTQSMAGEITANAVPEASLVSPPVSPPITTGVEGMPTATAPFQASTAAGNQTLAYSGLPDVSTMTPPPVDANYIAPQGSPINGLTETNVQAVGPATSPYSGAPATTTTTGAAPTTTAKPGMFDKVIANAEANPKYLAAAAVPGIVDEMTPKPYQAPEIKSDSDPGQQYMFESGYDNNLPGRTGQPSYTKISSEEAKKYYGYAEGGEVQYPVGEPVMRMASGGVASPNGGSTTGGGLLGNLAISTGAFNGLQDGAKDSGVVGYRYDPISHTYINGDAPAVRRMQPAQGNQYGTSDFTGYNPVDAYVAARGLGFGANYSGYDTPTNQGIAAVVPQAVAGANPNQRIIDLYKAADAKRAAEEAAAAKKAAISGNGYTIADNSKWGPLSPIYAGMMGQDVVGVKADGTPVYGSFTADENGVYGPGTSQYAKYQRQVQENNYMAGASGGSVSPEGFGVDAARGLGTGIDFSGYDTAPNQGRGITAALPQAVAGANPNQRIIDLYKADEAKRAAEAAVAAEVKRIADAAAATAQPMPFSIVTDGGGSYAAGGGISTLGGYSDGGRLLKGPGDGMSDNIPAQIGAKQPARLADGEFVVPADVVSHLGNGSTDAGAKQLYKMMDKIRTARTGRKAQGKQINPKKYLPA